jgi:hypothetical protein
MIAKQGAESTHPKVRILPGGLFVTIEYARIQYESNFRPSGCGQVAVSCNAQRAISFPFHPLKSALMLAGFVFACWFGVDWYGAGG